MVYNNNRDLAYFIIQCGARLRPWSWLQSKHLPEPLRQDKLLLNMITSATCQPQKLVLLCVTTVRSVLSSSIGIFQLFPGIIGNFYHSDVSCLNVLGEEVFWTELTSFLVTKI